jgi:type II secretory pathway pseudopilin PulG
MARPGRRPGHVDTGHPALDLPTRRQPLAAVPHSLRASVPSCLRAFTIVELIVVVTVIVLILAVAVPGLSAMNAQARLVSAQQLINGVTTRAYFLSLADRAMTAVRFFPGAWDTIDKTEKQAPGGRQHLAIYSYIGTTVQENASGAFTVQFGEYFQRTKNMNSVVMPEDVWAAPIEALSSASVSLPGGPYNPFGPNFVLSGTAGQFAFNAERVSGSDGGGFLNADDFLIVCDPDTGVRTGTPQPYRVRAYVPKYSGSYPTYENFENQGPGDPVAYQRYSFGGLITYRREAFAVCRTGQECQDYLRYEGRPFMVHRFSGGLLSGAGRP